MAHINKDRVKETTTTAGTGPFTVAGAMTGHKAFSSVCAVGDTFRGVIQAVDASGAPTGEWQAGTFTYSALNQITTLTVEWSSTGSAVSFSAGTKQIWIGMTAEQAGWIRERLSANRTYYVRSDGSDSNNGLTNTAGGAFLTVQKAVDVVYGTLDLAIYNVIVQVADGTYTGAVAVSGNLIGSGTLTIQGNATTPANVVFSTGANPAVTAQNDAVVTLKDFKVTTTNAGIYATKSGKITFSGLNFGSVSTHHIRVDDDGYVTCSGNYTISGGATTHYRLVSGTLRVQSKTVTLSGTPAFSSYFSNIGYRAIGYLDAITFSGAATGVRSFVELNGICYTNGGGTSYFPGSSIAGTPTATGGQYV